MVAERDSGTKIAVRMIAVLAIVSTSAGALKSAERLAPLIAEPESGREFVRVA